MRLETGNSKWASLICVLDGLLIAVSVICLYAFLMERYPIIYGGDTIIRLVDPSRILNGHQLPLLQSMIYLAFQVAYGPSTIFMLMALISAAACTGFYALTKVLTGNRRASWIVAILYASHPFILYYSRVPYQEPLLLAGMSWGFYFLFRPASWQNRFFASLFFAVACFSRHEGWIAALGAAVFEIWRIHKEKRAKTLISYCAPVLQFGWAPAVWILWNGDLSPAGSHVLDLGLQWSKLYRPYFIMKSALWWTSSAVSLLAVVGFLHSLLDSRMRKDPRFGVVLATLCLFMATLIFSGHGIDPDPVRILTEREAFIPMAVLVLYSGLGAEFLIGAIRIHPGNRIPCFGLSLMILTVVAGYSLDSGLHKIALANSDPDLKTDYEVARFLAGRHSSALVLAAPLPEDSMKDYLESVAKWSGARGRRKAAEMLKNTETTPLDYQRVLVYSWMGKDKIFSGDGLEEMDEERVKSFLRETAIEFIVVFSDFVPMEEHERHVMAFGVTGYSPAMEFRNAGKSGQIYSLRLP